MQKVNSFKVDHRALKPGIYASEVNGAITYDIRFIAPKHAHLVPSGAVLHTLEHFMASFFRNETPIEFSSSVLYVGPMGCKTGFYLVTTKRWAEEDIKDLVLKCCNATLCASEIPGGTEVECGNHRYFNLSETKDFIIDTIIPVFSEKPLSTKYPFLQF